VLPGDGHPLIFLLFQPSCIYRLRHPIAIHYCLKAMKVNAKVLNFLCPVIWDLEMTDVDQMDLTEPNHDLDEPASYTHNFYTEFHIRQCVQKQSAGQRHKVRLIPLAFLPHRLKS
jgi:hypothetical protein